MSGNNTNNAKTQLVLVTAFVVLFLLFKWYFLYIACGIGVLSVVSETIGNWIVYLWEQLGKGLAYINTKILLSLIFFVILTPIAGLARLFKKNEMKRNERLPAGESYYKVRNYQYVKKDLEDMW